MYKRWGVYRLQGAIVLHVYERKNEFLFKLRKRPSWHLRVTADMCIHPQAGLISD